MNKFKLSTKAIIVWGVLAWVLVSLWIDSSEKQHKPPLPLASPSDIISPDVPGFWENFERVSMVKRIKEADPVAYQNFKNSIYHKITVADFTLSYERLENKIIKKGLRYAPDSLVRAAMEKGTRVQELLLKHDPMLCYRLVSGRMTPEDKVRYFDILQTNKTAIEIQESFAPVAEQLIEYSHGDAPVIMDREKMKQQAIKVDSFIKSILGGIPSIPELHASVSTNEQAAFACNVEISLRRYISDDKNGDFSDLMRMLLLSSY